MLGFEKPKPFPGFGEPSDLEAFYADRATRGRLDGRGGLGQTSVRRLHTTLRRAFADTVRQNLLVRNPCDLLTRRPRRPASDPRSKAWTAERLRVFLEATRRHRLAAAWRVAAVTGMRRGELLGLGWEDVDLAAGRVSIRRTRVLVRGMPVTSAPKTRRSARTVALDPATVALLREWRARQLEERLAWGEGWQDSGHVFTREDGSALRPDTFSGWFRSLATSAGLPPIPLHGLRHSAATFHLGAGTPIAVVSDMLGHADSSVTMDVYSAVLPEYHRDAVDRLARALDG